MSVDFYKRKVKSTKRRIANLEELLGYYQSKLNNAHAETRLFAKKNYRKNKKEIK